MSQHDSPERLTLQNSVFIPQVVALIEAGHTVTLPLKGYSMRPFLENGRDSALLVKPTVLSVGQPVLAEVAPLHFVLHRIIAIDGDSVTLLGDGNLSPEHCTTKDVKALATGFYRKGRSELDTIDGKKWRIYSFLWMHLRPIRRWLLAIYRRII